MTKVKAFPLRIHKNAELFYDEYDDRLEFKLVNKENGEIAQRSYYKIDDGITVNEAVKIDTIIYHMHSEIKLNLWDI
jgi:hypothetical protein